MGLPVSVIPLELPSYQRKENFGADETFIQIVKALAKLIARSAQISCNLIGVTGLGFRHRDDIAEISGLLSDMGISVNVVAPIGSSANWASPILKLFLLALVLCVILSRKLRRSAGWTQW